MAVTSEPTPNPNALKFDVGRSVGGSATFSGDDVDDPLGSELLAVEGVVSVFMTADFVTLTKSGEGDWAEITPAATEILERHFS